MTGRAAWAHEDGSKSLDLWLSCHRCPDPRAPISSTFVAVAR